MRGIESNTFMPDAINHVHNDDKNYLCADGLRSRQTGLIMYSVH